VPGRPREAGSFSSVPAGSLQRRGFGAHAYFYLLFLFVLLLTHSVILDLPYFWDEMGQFIPAALDIFHDRAWIPRTTLPNVHPPGVMAYLAAVWAVAGYSVIVTRCAMLALAAMGVLSLFALAVHLCRPLKGLPAFTAPFFLLASPLFYSQSIMAQLDMPAMAFTALSLVLFLQGRYGLSALACTVLVLMKETSIAVPAVLGAILLFEQRWRQAIYFFAPAAVLVIWLLYLYQSTGHLFGNAEFTHYNVGFQLHPMRLAMTLVRRIYYIFIANLHIVGTIAIFLAWRRTSIFRTREWAVVAGVAVVQTLVVTVLGGAALERYLLPVLPVFYIAVAAALSTFERNRRRIAMALIFAGLISAIFIPPVFPFPFENNAAFIDFVELQRDAAAYIEATYSASTITSAWPFPDALRRREFGYVTRPIAVQGIDNFNPETVLALKGKVEVLVVYSRTWEPKWGVFRLDWIREFLTRYYFYKPQITREQIEKDLGLLQIAKWERHGQWIEIYAVSRTPNVLVL
jgi:4-amino-4-deoxy-L-arabinose transferase-like glycosyltransferase